MRVSDLTIQGVGMTSLRTRERLVARLQEQGITDADVLNVLLVTPRHLFVDEALAHRAYEDTALPIGCGQTLSQPLTVARMTQLLLQASPRPQKVLEIGTGSGYQTAVLAQLVERVFSVERVVSLHLRARQRLKSMGLRNIELKAADGYAGWAEQAPYDAILCAAAAPDVPQTLVEQLRPGGILLIPIGLTEQHLNLITRSYDGSHWFNRVLEPVRFVPFLPGITR